jgi:hypothetical protein
LYGGWALMIDPSGAIVNLHIEKLKLSPFTDFFVPGAILFFVLGWGSLIALPFVLKGTAKGTNFIILAGVIVSGWIVVQMIMMLEINWLHTVYILVGVALIITGLKAAKAVKN